MLNKRIWKLKERFNKVMMKRILTIGAPFGFEKGMFYFGRLIVLSVVSQFGTASIAANSVAGTIVMFEVLPGMAMNLGFSVIISRCVGAGDFVQAKYYKKKVRIIMHLGFLTSSGIVLLLIPLLMHVYSLSAEVSRKYGLSQDTLRYYERIGLLPNVNRSKSGLRDYTEDDCNWIEFIKCMRSAGLPIEVIIEYVTLFQEV